LQLLGSFGHNCTLKHYFLLVKKSGFLYYILSSISKWMECMGYLMKPKLRNVNAQRVMYQGEPAFFVQDGLKLTDAAIVVPQVLGPLLLLCDGQHSIPEIQAALEFRFGLRLTQQLIEGFITQFDEALLLEGDTYNRARDEVLEKYRAAPFRPPALANGAYPGEPEALRRVLQGYLNQVNGTPGSPTGSRGIISPHIDYQRGGPVYARVWASAAEAVRQAELVVIFGTDHNGGYGRITLTRQNYASPLGVMPTQQEIVDRLAGVLGPDAAFADELHHRGEHSIELALVWLQYIRGESACPVVPVLCGTFQHFMTDQASIDEAPTLQAFIEVLQEEASRRRTLIVAAGDLAHLGPAFDGPPLDALAQAQMKVEDEVLINSICQGDAETFFTLMKGGQYKRNVCGLSPFYFTLSVLGESRGHSIAYDRCPADADGTSFVSVCGVVLE
jgi:AmmeMemoRadiSam system protein B